ncbi:MAG: endonuclease/exonuclease/phosphatase family protein, partial [Planctomycetota bacterium]
MKHKLRWTRRKIIAISCFGLASVAIAGMYGFAPTMSGEPEVRPKVRRHSAASQPAVANPGRSNSLKVLTLNVAHGSGSRRNPILQKDETIKENLDEIAAVLRRERPDIAAVQEADGPSLWSGKVNQVSYLAEKGGFAYSVQAEHVKSKNISYGTGLL